MRLMLLDPEAIARDTVRRVASQDGHALAIADSLDAVVVAVEAEDVDCLVVGRAQLDSIPEPTKKSLFEAMKGNQVALLVLVGSPAELRGSCSVPDLIQDLVVKPLDPDILAARLELVALRRASLNRERAMLAVLPDLMFRVTKDGTYIDVHASNEADLYVPPRELLGKKVGDLLPPRVADQIQEKIRESVRTGKPCSVEYALEVPSGSTHFEARVIRSGADEVLAIVRDISEQKRLLAEIQKRRAQARAFATRTLEVLESERQHLAQELHDVIGQMLLVHRMDVEWIAKRSQGPATEAANALARSLDETLQAVRNLALGLRPPILDDLGIGSALQELSGEMTRRSGISIECTIDPAAASLDRNTAVAVYRIAQEALSNAVRHSECHNIEVSLDRPNGKVELRVEDDGRGIAEATLAQASTGAGRSLGLLGMRERAGLLGGDVQVLPRTPSGTVILATIPQPETQAEDR